MEEAVDEEVREAGLSPRNRTSSFSDMRNSIKSRMRRTPSNPDKVEPRPLRASPSNSLDEEMHQEVPLRCEHDAVKRIRVNSFSGMKNVMRDKLNNVKTRVRRISSHSKTNGDKPGGDRPPKGQKSPDPISEQTTPEVSSAVRRIPSISCSPEPGELDSFQASDLPPQPRSRVNSFNDLKHGMREKLRNVQARVRRRSRVANDADVVSDLGKQRSLSVQNLTTPMMTLRVSSTPDVSQIGLKDKSITISDTLDLASQDELAAAFDRTPSSDLSVDECENCDPVVRGSVPLLGTNVDYHDDVSAGYTDSNMSPSEEYCDGE